MQSKIQSTTKKRNNMEPQVVAKQSREGRQAQTKTENEFLHFGSPKSSKTKPMNHPKIIKNRFGSLSSNAKI